jgi:serine/threonine protein kinase
MAEISASQNSPKVFLSYSHDSKEHKSRVLIFCNRLRQDGIDAWIDEYETSPPEGWPRWCAKRIQEAESVLVICTETYERRFRGSEEAGRGLGTRWEGYVATQELYEAGARNTKFIPILFSSMEEEQIPIILRGSTHYDVSSDEGYWRLVRRLMGQPETVPPPLGGLEALMAHRHQSAKFVAGPQPKYNDERTRRLGEDLAIARQQFKDLMIRGQATEEIKEKILQIRREMREGGRFQPGDCLDGRFQLLNVLGRGGFATVWRAWDEGKQRLVAVKILHGFHAEDRSRRERFFRGARKMAELHHPGVVQIFEECLEESGHYYFVMEYVEGGDLRQAIIEGKLAREKIVPLILEVGEALVFAHEKGIIHRDVKPANVLLHHGRPKLTDFDLVRADDTTGGTQTEGHLGTFLYSAPEALTNAKSVGVAADVYSLAMTAIFALHGRDLPPEVFWSREVLLEGLPCPAAVRDTLRRGIALEVNERLASVQSFCKLLEQSEVSVPVLISVSPPIVNPEVGISIDWSGSSTQSSSPALARTPDVANGVNEKKKDNEIAPLILLVDDVDHGREIFGEFLEFRGFRVATAADGLEALEKAFELIPDVILMDLSLPGIDGWEATRRLKQDERTQNIPVIALTAHQLQGAHDMALKAGCEEVVTKPCLPKDLENAINRHLVSKN